MLELQRCFLEVENFCLFLSNIILIMSVCSENFATCQGTGGSGQV